MLLLCQEANVSFATACKTKGTARHNNVIKHIFGFKVYNFTFMCVHVRFT